MANRYWLPIGAGWNTSDTDGWSSAAPISFTASKSGTTLTTSGSPALVVGMTVTDNVGASLGTIVSGSGNSWVMSASDTRISMTMNAATTGASAPTAADDIFFQSPAQNTLIVNGGLCRNITVSAGAVVTFSGSGTGPTISGSMSLVAGTLWSIGATRTTTFNATSTGQTITTNGVSLSSGVTFNGVGGGWTLGSSLTLSQTLTVTNGTFNSGNYAITTSGFSSSNSNTRSISLGSSTVTISQVSSAALNLSTITGLTWNAGTSQINLSGSTSGISAGGVTFYNVAFTLTSGSAITLAGVNTFSGTLSFAGRTSVGRNSLNISDNQTIGTLTLNAGTAAAYRSVLRSDVAGTQRTLTVTSLTAGAADYDFIDIAIVGSAAPLTGTRFGDAGGNSGITFPAARTVYYRAVGGGNWGATGSGAWSLTSGGTAVSTAFPLVQDTAVFPAATYPASGSTTTINQNYSIGTIDMSLRTTNTLTLALGSATPSIYGNWINGTGTTVTEAGGYLTFVGRGIQTITSANKTFPNRFVINSIGGTVKLADNFNTSFSTVGLTITSGTFDAVTYNVTLSGGGSSIDVSGTSTRTVAIGSGTWSIAGTTGAWDASTSTNLTVTGTGTISLTSASAKTFAGGGIQTYPTLNQGGTGTLTVTGSNQFAAVTATTAGTVSLTSGTTTQVPLINTTGTDTVTVSPTSTTATIRGSVRSSRSALTGPLVLGAL